MMAVACYGINRLEFVSVIGTNGTISGGITSLLSQKYASYSVSILQNLYDRRVDLVAGLYARRKF